MISESLILESHGIAGSGNGGAMHICLVSCEYPPETAHGGIGSQTYLKAHGLAALGHTITVISRSPDAKTHSYNDGAVRVTRIPGLDYRFPIYTTEVDWLTYSTQAAATIFDLHQREPFDLLDVPEWGCEGYVHLLNRPRWVNLPTVIHLHGPLVMFAHAIGWPEIDSEFYRTGMAMEGTCLRLADRIFSSSRCSARWCAKYYGIDLQRVPILHMGIDTMLFQPRDVPRDSRPTVVFVGSLADNKGARLLVESACMIARDFPGLRIKLIGNGKPEQKKRIISAASAAGFPDMVEMAGFIAREELSQHLSRAHVFAAPSSYEGGPGFVYLEAMACRLPVIACSGSGAAEVVSDGINGLLVPPHDRVELAKALRSLLSSAEMRQSMGNAGLAYVKAEADTRVCVKRLEAFYMSVIRDYAAAATKGGGT